MVVVLLLIVVLVEVVEVLLLQWPHLKGPKLEALTVAIRVTATSRRVASCNVELQLEFQLEFQLELQLAYTATKWRQTLRGGFGAGVKRFVICHVASF
ncbi:hypothetical protein ACLKA6_017865 [Drosophila palustris]